MKQPEKNPDNARHILSGVYMSQDQGPMTPVWHRQVMGAIRSLPEKDSKDTYFQGMEQMVWKFAPVACMLILVMAVVLAAQDFTPEYGLFEAFMDDSMSGFLAQAVGVK